MTIRPEAENKSFVTEVLIQRFAQNIINTTLHTFSKLEMEFSYQNCPSKSKSKIWT